MACNCGKIKGSSDMSNVIKMAMTESNVDREKYVIYEFNGKMTYDKMDCWKKAGRIGKVKQIIYPV